jgi:plasmid stabilization system protein ParE
MLEFLEDASVELELAVAWYENQRAGLGAKFLQALRDTVQYAQDSPGIGTLVQDAPERFDLRWYIMQRFPYALLVGRTAGIRTVVAVAHLSRKPGYWKDRLIKLH